MKFPEYTMGIRETPRLTGVSLPDRTPHPRKLDPTAERQTPLPFDTSHFALTILTA